MNDRLQCAWASEQPQPRDLFAPPLDEGLVQAPLQRRGLDDQHELGLVRQILHQHLSRIGDMPQFSDSQRSCAAHEGVDRDGLVQRRGGACRIVHTLHERGDERVQNVRARLQAPTNKQTRSTNRRQPSAVAQAMQPAPNRLRRVGLRLCLSAQPAARSRQRARAFISLMSYAVESRHCPFLIGFSNRFWNSVREPGIETME